MNVQQVDNKENLKFFIFSREREKDNFFFSIKDLPNYRIGIFVEKNGNSQENSDIAKVVGKMLEERLEKKATLDKKKLEILIFEAHKDYREKYGTENGNSCSIVIFITDFSKILFINTGNLKYQFYRDGKVILKNRDHTVAYLMYEANKISYEDIKNRKNSNRLIHKFGVDKSIVIDITDPLVIKKDDKILIYNHDIWKIIEDNNVFLSDPYKVKKIFDETENYLFFNGTVLDLDNEEIIKEAEIVPKDKFFSALNRYKFCLAGVFLFGGIFLGVKTYIFYNTANQLYALAVKNETVGNVEFESQNFKLALREYEVSLQKYIEYYDYTGKIDTGKEEYMRNLIAQTEIAIDIQEELEKIEELIYDKEFKKALKKINSLNIQVQHMKNKENLEEKIIDLYTTALLINIAYENKLTADTLITTYKSNPEQNYNLKKKAEKLYEKSAMVFLENSLVDLYEEIAKKQMLDIENIVKYQNASEIIRSANKAFREFKYYKSLKLYTSALKLTKNPKTIEVLNHKIKMNNIVLKGVEAELEGDKIKRGSFGKKDIKKAIIKYKEAKKYYSILDGNTSMPQFRYKNIMDRITKKINEN